jgi:hypothetical protein
MVYPVFFFNRLSIREKVEKQIKNSKKDLVLEKMVFYKDSPEYHKFLKSNVKEFSFRDALYDVTKIIRQPGSITVFAFNDVKEKQLVSGFLSHQDNSVINLCIIKLLSFVSDIHFLEISFIRQYSISPLALIKRYILTNPVEVLKPPPRFFL